jgi:endoglucanase
LSSKIVVSIGSQWKPAFYNANCINWLVSDWRCSIVRASMAVGSGGYLTNPTGETAKVKAVVDAAIAAGIYVVIDFHETGNGNTDLAAAKTFFGDMSKTYGQYPNVIYETWNEPDNTMAWATVIKPYHEAVIPVIRANDPDNLILCGTKSWSQDVDEASLNPITISSNIIYTLHFYAATHKQSLRDKAQIALNNGIALMVTEGGLSQASGNGAIDTAEARLWLNFMNANYISWMNWSIADLTESSAALVPGASGNGGWTASQISPSGTWVRNALRAMYVPPTAIFLPRLIASGGRLLADNAGLDGKIFDVLGRMVHEFPVNEQNVRWNGTDLYGNALSNGFYIVQTQGKKQAMNTGGYLHVK